MHVKHFLIAIFVFVALMSCVRDVDFDPQTGFPDSIVIQGRIVKGNTSFVEVRFSNLTGASLDSTQNFDVQEVIIFDDEGTEMELFTDIRFRYRTILDSSSPIYPEVGKAYGIRATLFDGRILESTLDKLQPNPDPISLHLSASTELVRNAAGTFVDEERIELSIDTDIDSNNEGGILWDVENVYKVFDTHFIGPLAPDWLPRIFQVPNICYITQKTNVNDIVLIDSRGSTINELRDFSLAKISITSELVDGYYFVVKQYSLSPDAMDYWASIDFLFENMGSIFDRPVGEVSSNITNVNDPTVKSGIFIQLKKRSFEEEWMNIFLNDNVHYVI